MSAAHAAAMCGCNAVRQAAAAVPPRAAAGRQHDHPCLPAALPAATALPQHCRALRQMQQGAHSLQRRRFARATAAASGSGSGSSNSAAGRGPGDGKDEQEEEEGPPPTEEEMEEAQRVLKDFLEGMGASGVPLRPEDANLPEGRLSWEDVNSILGMGSWRLHDKAHPLIQELVAQIEGCWRAVLPGDQFGLYQLEERFKYLDSLDPEGAQPFSFMGLEDPQKGEPGYPRLQIENRAYWSRAFRKLHIEVAVRQDGLQVFHCVMYPRLTYDLPILSMDLVANDGRVSLAVVDPCPLSPDLRLPPFYEAPVRQLQAKHGLESNRAPPEWGEAIFSPLCVLMRPSSNEEVKRFVMYALELTRLHVQIAKIAHPVTTSPGAKRRVAALHAGHQRYCAKQLENDKTRRVLEAAFGSELTEAYMTRVMFDVEPLPADV